IMADLSIPANDAPVEQAPAVAPPTRTDDQILPLSKWVPIGKRNCVLDFSVGFALTHLDDITPANDNNPFVAPSSSDTVIEYVNTLGYPSTLRNVLAMSVNALYQPWRAILSMINMCLTGKTVGYDRPRHLEESSYSCMWKEEGRSSAHSKYAKRGKAEEGGAIESYDATKVTKPKATKVTKPAVSKKKRKLVKETPDEPSLAKRSKGGLVGKRRKPKSSLKLVDDPSDEGVPVEEPAHTDEEADL
ncbi:hypothetical protein Tco_0929231, partial [Tanacetum coccineum]